MNTDIKVHQDKILRFGWSGILFPNLIGRNTEVIKGLSYTSQLTRDSKPESSSKPTDPRAWLKTREFNKIINNV